MHTTKIPDVNKRPQWANYWSSDKDGNFYWCENEPLYIAETQSYSFIGKSQAIPQRDLKTVTLIPLSQNASA